LASEVQPAARFICILYESPLFILESDVKHLYKVSKMEKIWLRIAVLATACVSSSVFAQSNGSGSSWYTWFQNWWNNFWNTWNNGGGHSGGGYSVPELDGATGPLAIALITVVVGIGLERNRRRKQKESSVS